MRYDLQEHKQSILIELVESDDGNNYVDFSRCSEIKPRKFKRKQQVVDYFKVHCTSKDVKLEADYYVGIDWLLENEKFVYVAPKINSEVITKFKKEASAEIISEETEELNIKLSNESGKQEINYLKMYMDAATHPEIFKHTDGLLFVDWDAPQIPIEQHEDMLTPFLIVQYLKLLQQIVRKGLKKSYYKVQANLQNRIKGKILVGKNIKRNVLKNRSTHTLCEYQEFGIDNIENRFLKKVLRFASNYIANHYELFKGNGATLKQILAYCTPVFENVSDEYNEYELKHFKSNVFFQEYKGAIKVGQFILKRFAYNISTTSQQTVTTPPFWIDMPRLFELYVYKHLLDVFPAGDVKYHYTTYGNELDFLITAEGREMVIDAKYKLQYKSSLIHDDIRQVSGYARLQKIYNELNVDNDRLIDCLIIYPDQESIAFDNNDIINWKKGDALKAYRQVFKKGIKLPLL